MRALDAWLEASGIKAGPIFRGIDRHGHMKDRALSDQSVADVVQRVATAAGSTRRTSLLTRCARGS